MRLVLFLFVAVALLGQTTPAGWQVLFRDDFEHGDGAWNVTGDTPSTPLWAVENEGGNWVYSASSRTFALANAGPWTDFSLRLRVKLLSGTLHLNFRHTMCGRYFAALGGGSLNLVRMLGCYNHTNLVSAPGDFAYGRWYNVEVLAVGANVKVYVDGALKLDYTDPNPVLLGTIGLEALDDTHVHVDDIVLTGPAPAQPLTWVRTGGPHGGVGYDIRVRPDNPDYLMVTDNASGVSVSSDGGRTWQASNEGIRPRSGVSGDAIPVFCLTIDPNNSQVVWIGTQDRRGIYKSTDGGKTWIEKDQGVVEKNGITFRGFTVDPRDSRTVYAAAQVLSTAWAGRPLTGKMFDLSKGVVYKTTDGGENWRAVWRGDNLARYIWIDPRNSSVLYVSTGIFDCEAANSDPARSLPGGVGILKSTDGGNSWRVLNGANGLGNLYVGSLFMHPRNPDILLAGTGHAVYADGEGVYLSTDAGETWRRTMGSRYLMDSVNGDQITAVEFATSDPKIAYAASGLAFYRSEDGGVTWTMPAGKPESPGFGPPGMQAGIPMDLQVDPRNANRVFVNNYTGGNLLSEDGGYTWQLASQGYTGAALHDISGDPADSRRVYTIGRSGVFRSDDAGKTWIGLNYTAHDAWGSSRTYGPLAEWYGVATDPSEPGKVLFADEMSGLLLLSTQFGQDWKVVFAHPETTNEYGHRHGFKALAFAPSNSQVIYAGMSADRVRLQAFPNQTSYGVYKSLDGGATWRESNDARTAQQNINALVVDPRNENVAYAGTVTAGVVRTQDGGRSWQPLNEGLRGLDVRALAIDTKTQSVMYAGIENGGVYKSVDGGAHWQMASAGMDPGAQVRDIVIDPTNSNVVYAADLRTGVYRSQDGGTLWTALSQGLSTRAVKSLSLSSDASTLYAATEGEGVFRLDLKARSEGAAATVSAATFLANIPVAPESIASVFGPALAAATEHAPQLPLPTMLSEVSVSVTDSEGGDRWAPLFFVSPGQINFQVPPGTHEGPAQVRVLLRNRVVARGEVRVERVAPGLFAANGDGRGAPAAGALRVAANGAQSVVSVFHCGTAPGSCTPVPVDLGEESDKVILVLYGTGIRAGAETRVRIGGVEAPVEWTGPQGLVGLDQVNVRLPRELKGRGEMDLLLTVDGKTANPLEINVR